MPHLLQTLDRVLQGVRVQGIELAARPVHPHHVPGLLLLEEGDEDVLLLGHPPVLLVQLPGLGDDVGESLRINRDAVEALDHLELVELVVLRPGDEEVGLVAALGWSQSLGWGGRIGG